MRVTLDTNDLPPASIATIIAALLVKRTAAHVHAIQALLVQLDQLVGDEEMIEYLVDAGVTFEQVQEVEDSTVDRPAAPFAPRPQPTVDQYGDYIFA